MGSVVGGFLGGSILFDDCFVAVEVWLWLFSSCGVGFREMLDGWLFSSFGDLWCLV